MSLIVTRIHSALMLVINTTAKAYKGAINKALDLA